MSALTHPAYDELIDFILQENPERYANFQASEKVRERVWDLVHREKTEGLDPAETAELNTYMQFEHIMRLAKAKARLLLIQRSAQSPRPNNG